MQFPERMSAARRPTPIRTVLDRFLGDDGFRNAALAALFDDAGDAMLLLDERGRFLGANRLAVELLRATGRELEGLTLVDLQPARNADTGLETFERVLRERKIHTQVLLRRRDGSTFPADVSMSAVDVDGRSLVSMILRDATPREQVQQELARARDEAVAAARTKTRFLASMSHEIRTPLNVIMGYNALIRGKLVQLGDDGHDSLLHQTQEASARLMTTLNGILDMSKLESGGFQRKPVSVHLPTIVEDLASDLRVLAASGGVQLICRIDEPEATVAFDEYCLTRSLTNLIQNALQFTERGTVTLHLYREGQGDLRLDVVDTGRGIDSDALERIFEPFAQERFSPPHREGSGLGLALVRQYLEINGASISAHSQRDEGSRFSIRFDPSSEMEPPARGARRSGEAATSPSNAPRPVTLLVEDDVPTQAYMESLLQSRYQVLSAATGEEARGHLESDGNRIRIVLMDLSLKGSEDGLSLTRAIRAHPEWRRLPVVAITAHAFPEDRRAAFDAGCDAFLTKPLDHEELLLVMDRLVRERAQAA